MKADITAQSAPCIGCWPPGIKQVNAVVSEFIPSTSSRRFPKRSDLIVAVFRREVDSCADAAEALAAEHQPFEALSTA
jgi:hypothetical protein